jgi:hypothetical protein
MPYLSFLSGTAYYLGHFTTECKKACKKMIKFLLSFEIFHS